VRRLAFGVWRSAFGVWRSALADWRLALNVNRASRRYSTLWGNGRMGLMGHKGLMGPVRSRALERCLACEADRSETESHAATTGRCSRRHSSLSSVARHPSDIYGTHQSHQSHSSPCRNRDIAQQRVSCYRPIAERQTPNAKRQTHPLLR
jgi:hypothetical protein